MASAVAPHPTVVGASRARVAAAACALVAGAGVGVMTLDVASAAAERPTWVTVTHLVALVLGTAATLATADRHVMAAQGLALYTGTLAVAQLAALATLPDRAQLALWATGLLGVLAAAWVALGWRAGRTRPLLLTGTLVGAACALLVFGFNPLHEPRCPVACPDVPAMAHFLQSSRGVLAVAASLSLAAVLVAVAATWRARAVSTPTLVVVAGLAAAASSAAPLAIRALGWHAFLDTFAVLVLPSLGGVALATAVLATAFTEARARVVAARIGEFIAGLDEQSVAAGTVQFAVPGEGRWIDAAGSPVTSADGYVVVKDDGAPIARIAAGARPGFAEEHFGPAQVLAIRNAQLTALARLRVAELQASRRRIVDLSDAESRRIERDLHDGAQQRLVSSMLYLAVAREADPRLVELGDAEHALSGALGHLRSLAHGIYPEVLRTEGVWAALDDAADNLPIPVRLAWADALKPPEPIGHALFAATVGVLELACAPPPARRVELRAESRTMRVDLHIRIVGKAVTLSDLVDAGDRVGALGGRMVLVRSGADTEVTLGLPCAS